MFKRIAFFIVLAFCFNQQGFAGIKDSISFYLKNSKPELIGGLSSRNTFIGSNKTSVSGANIGFSFGGKVKTSAGIYWLSKPMEEPKRINAFTPAEYRVNQLSRFWYFGLTGNYTFFQDRKWTMDIPLRIGVGSSNTKNFAVTPDKTLLSRRVTTIVPIESGVNVLYKLTWWVGLGAGIGSRVVLGKDAQRFSGTYYTLGVNIFFGDIYTHITKDIKRDPLAELL